MSPGDYVLIGVLAFLVFLGILFFILWYTNPKFRAKFGICKSGMNKTEEKIYTVVSPKKNKHKRKIINTKEDTLENFEDTRKIYLSGNQNREKPDWPILDDTEPVLPPDYNSIFEKGGKKSYPGVNPQGSYPRVNLKEEDYIVNPRNIAIEDELPLG
jgi:hypothetical protein